MEKHHHERSTFSGKLGFVLSAAGASVGLGNIWRFPYLAAKYGGGIFLLIYIILALTFGYSMLIAETALGRMTRKESCRCFWKIRKIQMAVLWRMDQCHHPDFDCTLLFCNWWLGYQISAGICKRQQQEAWQQMATSVRFIANGFSTEVCFLIFAFLTVAIIYAGVRNGVERVSKFMMPILVFLSIIITVYSVTRPGALAGVKYFLVPNVENFSWMTVVSAMGQMFYSLSIAMGILVTFGSYMKKDVSIEGSTRNVEIFDTAIAIMAGLMIIPAVFAFSGGDPDTLQAGPALMFITIPKVFASMGFGTPIGILVLPACTLRSPYQLHSPDRERSIHISG